MGDYEDYQYECYRELEAQAEYEASLAAQAEEEAEAQAQYEAEMIAREMAIADTEKNDQFYEQEAWEEMGDR